MKARHIARDQITISTKIARLLQEPDGQHPFDPQGWVGGDRKNQVLDYSAEGAWQEIRRCLQNLQTEYIDFLLLHDIDRQNHGPRYEQHLATATQGAWAVLLEARKAGTATKVGMGVNNWEPYLDFLKVGLKPDVLLLAGRYTLIEQTAMSAVFPAAVANGTDVWLGGIFNSGILATGNKPDATYNYVSAPPDIREKVNRLKSACESRGVPLGAAALQFASAHPAVHTCILGPGSVDELRQCLEWFRQPIPGDFWEVLKQRGEIEGAAPVPGNERDRITAMRPAPGKAEPT
jgi:D-threo-aldose 1-dehydrogenase